jgi:hypothetical protein
MQINPLSRGYAAKMENEIRMCNLNFVHKLSDQGFYHRTIETCT